MSVIQILTFFLAKLCGREEEERTTLIGPALPTGIGSSRLRSGVAHWDRELAVEVRHCPLGSGARRCCPAVPTGMRSWQMESGSAYCDLQLATRKHEENEEEEEKKEEEEGNNLVFVVPK
eukprot:s44_g49.t1